VVVSQLLLDPGHLHAVGEVGGDAGGRAILGQLRDRFIDPGLIPADDDGAAAAHNDVGGRVVSYSTAAADYHQFVALEVRSHLTVPPARRRMRPSVAVSPPPHIVKSCAVV
jgi:hypothetical protein